MLVLFVRLDGCLWGIKGRYLCGEHDIESDLMAGLLVKVHVEADRNKIKMKHS